MPRVGEDGVRELDFECTQVLNPTLQSLALRHCRTHAAGHGAVPGALQLLFYRPPGRDDARW
jgi:hypothetical protein